VPVADRTTVSVVGLSALLGLAALSACLLVSDIRTLRSERGRLERLKEEEAGLLSLADAADAIEAVWRSVVQDPGLPEGPEAELAAAVAHVEKAAREAGAILGGIAPARKDDAVPPKVEIALEFECTETELVRFLGAAALPPGYFGVERLHVAPAGKGAQLRCDAVLHRASIGIGETKSASD